MTDALRGKRIAVGVCGGIAAYKVLAVVSRLVQAGVAVNVLMTEAASRFVAPLSFAALTHRPIHTDPWAMDADGQIAHIAVAEAADLLLVAPATAHTLAKLAHGLADDAVTLAALATRAPSCSPRLWMAACTNILPRKRMWPCFRRAAAPSSAPRLADWPPASPAAAGWRSRRPSWRPWRRASRARPTWAGCASSSRPGGRRNRSIPSASSATAARARWATPSPTRPPRAARPSRSSPRPPPCQRPPGSSACRSRRWRGLRQALHDRLDETDVIIQAAAVSDYRVAQPAADKIKRHGEEVVLGWSRTRT